jgi:GntR family transcriptional regulator
MLGVSRTTVRSALQSLEQHGVLTRTPRRGTLVRGRLSPSLVALHRLIGFSRLLEEQGYTVNVISGSRLTKAAPREVSETLGLRRTDPVYEVSRLFTASGKPAIWAVNYLGAASFRHVPTDDDLAQSPFDMGDLLLGGPVDHALVEIVPMKAAQRTVRQLRMKPGEPYMLLKETHFSETGTTLGFSHIHVNDRFVRFRLYRGGDGR